MPLRVACRCLVGVLFACTVAHAADPTPQEQLDAVQHDLDAVHHQGAVLSGQERGLKADITRLQAAEVTAARDVQSAEAQVSASERDLAALQQKETAEASALASQKQHETAVLMALGQLATMPPSLVAAAPGSPVDVARSGILLGATAPALQADVQALAASVAELHRTQADLAASHDDLLRRRQSLQDQQKHLTDLLDQRRSLEGETAQKIAASQQRANLLVAQASTLQQAIDRLDRDNEEHARTEAAEAARENQDRAKATQEAALHPPVAAPAAAGPGPAGGHLVLPAAGTVTKRFGEPDGASTAKGISFATRASAQIVAPAAGQVLFTGPFKGYGQILIIDHGGGYHSLLAGLGRIDCAVGQKIAGGEPVGIMPADGTPVLYLEVRRQNEPVDPAPWLAIREQKASG
jgi:septal ring factor EnvC (AmiA/AmiB activator)